VEESAHTAVLDEVYLACNFHRCTMVLASEFLSPGFNNRCQLSKCHRKHPRKYLRPSPLIFADDNTFLSEDPDGLQLLIDNLVLFCATSGLQIGFGKHGVHQSHAIYAESSSASGIACLLSGHYDFRN
jgi:hypothetical protein